MKATTDNVDVRVKDGDVMTESVVMANDDEASVDHKTSVVMANKDDADGCVVDNESMFR